MDKIWFKKLKDGTYIRMKNDKPINQFHEGLE